MTFLIHCVLLFVSACYAYADVDFYGLIDLSYGKNGNINNESARLHSGGDNGGFGGGGGGGQGNSTSRIGLKGNFEIANDLKANFKFETAEIDRNLRIGEFSKTFFARQAWASISGYFGEVRYGRQNAIPFQAMIPYDFNGAANAATALAWSGVAPWGKPRITHSLVYIIPNLYGFTAQIGLAGKEDGQINAKTTKAGSLTYASGKLSVSMAAQSKSTSNQNDFTSMAASYNFEIFKVMAGYTDGFFGTGWKGHCFGIAAPVAGFNIGIQYGKNTVSKTNEPQSAVEYFIKREVFKNTFAYADYSNVHYTNASSKKAYAFGFIYVFQFGVFK